MIEPARLALPPEAPLAMPRQRINGILKPMRARAGGFGARLRLLLVRLLLIAGTFGLIGYGIHEMYGVMSSGGVTLLQWVFLALFAVTFSWVGIAACQAVAGFLRVIGQDLFPPRLYGEAPAFRTAVLLPLYNEDPRRAAAAVRAMAEGLAERAPDRFAFFLLSDTNQPSAWIDEERTFRTLVAEADPRCPVWYRHRRHNTERKAGNIADWVMRWGAAFEAMIVLDADSLIDPATLVELAARMEKAPGVGLIQTLPSIVGGRSLYARLQQFANRCYGPVFGNGLAAWHGVSSNFWGHNAIIRTRAFAEAARMPELPGKPPFGGHVLSHDFIEAALLRRAGWGVRLDSDLKNSFEEAPPSLVDVMVRDRRWCQGNLQHSRFLRASGLAFASRLHLLTGIMAYLSAPLWFALVFVGLMLAVQVALSGPEYFSGPSLFPIWPVFDSERAIRLFVVSMIVVMTPKLLGWLAVMLNPKRCLSFGGPIAVTLGVLVETALSALYAPLMMIAQSHIVWQVLSGGDSGWKPQRRGDGSVPFRAALRAHYAHMIVGLVLGAVSWAINPDLFLWTLPVTGGLALAPFTSAISGSTIAGSILRALWILRTPEERRRGRPAILNRRDALFAQTDEEVVPPLQALANDPGFRAWHLAQIPEAIGAERAFNPELVLAREKSIRAGNLSELETWLTPREKMELLHNSDSVLALAERDAAAAAQ